MAPTTPTKSKARDTQSPASGHKATHVATMDTVSLGRRFSHLEDRHNALQAEYDAVRARYQEDLRYWKEYKTAIDARRTERHVKREAKRAARAGSTSRTHSSGIKSSQSSTTPDQKVDNSRPQPLVEASDESVPRRAQDPPRHTSGSESSEIIPAIPPPNVVIQREMSTSQMSQPSQSLSQTVFLPYGMVNAPPEEASSAASGSRPSTATPTSSRGLTRLPSRTTPWLGATTSATPKATSHKTIVHRSDDEDFGEGDTSAELVVALHTPLVRDRGLPVSSAKDTSLRRTALTKHRVEHETPSKDVDDSALVEAGKKRKHMEVNTASPLVKALELKRLNQMSVAEKREYYAQYKGRGRYTAPQEM